MLNKRSLAVTAVAALALAGCSTAPEADRPRVLAAIYPVQFLAQQVAGDRALVDSLTPSGAEPHDLEIAPAQVRRIGTADVLVFVSGFQPAVDEAIAASGGSAQVVDATSVLGLELDHDDDHDEDHDDDESHPGLDHHDGHDHDGDPHFWLDPTLLAALAQPLAEALSAVDPGGAATFAANAERIASELAELDAEYTARLSTCERREIVVGHEAYGYLAERYGLTQVGLSGIDPESEPSPARLREIRAAIAEHEVTTIFTETLVNPKAAEVLAKDLGLATALLDPVEAQVDPEADYRDVMRANLEALSTALGCA